jgi:endonuclease-8
VPEGHTLHRAAAEFRRRLVGRTVHVDSPQGRFAEEAATLDGARLRGAEAYGKHLLLDLRQGRRSLALHVHLGLFGGIEFHDVRARHPAPPPRGQVRVRLIGVGTAVEVRGPTVCAVLDPIQVDELLARIGPDPLRPDADQAAAYARVKASARPIAALLMDQRVVGGVGNVYRAEVLFRRGIDPYRPGSSLMPTEWAPLWSDLVSLMGIGLATGRIDTVEARHLPEIQGRAPRADRHGGEVYVYRRAGQPCLVCGAMVATAVVDARNLFWCPRCQQHSA